MNNRSLEHFLQLEYPITIIHTDEGYEAWNPDFGRSAAVAGGKTVAATLRSLESIRKVHITELYESGCEIPEPSEPNYEAYSGRFVVRIPKELHRDLTHEAVSNGISLNSYVLSLLSERHITSQLDRKLSELIKDKVA